MQMADIKNPDERKKLILAVALGIVALLFLWWTFFGFGGTSKPAKSRIAANPPASPGLPRPLQPVQPGAVKGLTAEQLRPVVFSDVAPSIPEATRNIFAFYEKPVPAATPSVLPAASPTPTPPLLVAALSPSNIYARTDDFTLEVTGDKFTPEVRITLDGRELTTRFVSPQQLSATVPASIIANAGPRQVLVRSPSGKLYSNSVMLDVTPPPTPNYTYVGIIGYRRFVDTAILQDKGSREILNVQRGDILGGRFRLTSISEKELVLVDTTLKIKHTLPFTSDREKGTGPQLRPTPKVESEDDEP